MKNDYEIRKKADAINIAMTAGKINDKKESLSGKTISWESFTEDYMGFKIPNTSDSPEDKLATVYWKNARSTWLAYLNEEFLKEKYPCKLFVAYNQEGGGVFIAVNGVVPDKTALKEYKKIFNTHSTSRKRINVLNESETYPEANRMMRGFLRSVDDASIYMLGQLSIDRMIPSDIKRELKAIIEKSLPSSDEE